ncbi:MAG: helix-turn-helix transcriptional regulator [Oscillospiraceae bacterium]|nr:helix-turn-helix transcriptional regulator [Oscillospiraceae bacterium]
MKTLRQDRKIGLREFSRRLGVTTAAVLKMERPGNYPSADKLPLIADVLDCSIDALYGRPSRP